MGADLASRLDTRDLDTRDKASPSFIICREHRRARKGLRVGSSPVRQLCTRRHMLPGSAAFRGQAEVRPPSGQAHAGLGRGQLKARRRPLALGEPPEAEAAPSKVTWLLSVRGVGPRAGQHQQCVINPCLPGAPSSCRGLP